MRTFTLLKGQPVFNKSTGEIIGHVSDLKLSIEGNIDSIVIDQKGLFGRDRHIPVQDITSFGHDGVMIKPHEESQSVGYDKEGHYLCHGHGLIGQMLFTTEGEKLGIVEDVYFDENLGTIIGYEVSEGFFADITEGKKVVKTANPLQFGQDIILIEINT
ncbi:PRC-barrel domain-containing protein [Bacillus suaedaesalsae]|uniref:PRC-barrel domain-containing protein n=1 Tax=Bacillus suaedaesalsae TaxID=2810349 RepID=A0ABS2DMW0_9BACI|nr:PRC-barrel domain-containing protein [Bacillus suaedaesalsae]MBM6619692.1 PRC-barrel domain-containing protein [Bacillus suaedaesalsae]